MSGQRRLLFAVQINFDSLIGLFFVGLCLSHTFLFLFDFLVRRRMDIRISLVTRLHFFGRLVYRASRIVSPLKLATVAFSLGVWNFDRDGGQRCASACINFPVLLNYIFSCEISHVSVRKFRQNSLCNRVFVHRLLLGPVVD